MNDLYELLTDPAVLLPTLAFLILLLAMGTLFLIYRLVKKMAILLWRFVLLRSLILTLSTVGLLVDGWDRGQSKWYWLATILCGFLCVISWREYRKSCSRCGKRGKGLTKDGVCGKCIWQINETYKRFKSMEMEATKLARMVLMFMNGKGGCQD